MTNSFSSITSTSSHDLFHQLQQIVDTPPIRWGEWKATGEGRIVKVIGFEYLLEKLKGLFKDFFAELGFNCHDATRRELVEYEVLQIIAQARDLTLSHDQKKSLYKLIKAAARHIGLTENSTASSTPHKRPPVSTNIKTVARSILQPKNTIRHSAAEKAISDFYTKNIAHLKEIFAAPQATLQTANASPQIFAELPIIHPHYEADLQERESFASGEEHEQGANNSSGEDSHNLLGNDQGETFSPTADIQNTGLSPLPLDRISKSTKSKSVSESSSLSSSIRKERTNVSKLPEDEPTIEPDTRFPWGLTAAKVIALTIGTGIVYYFLGSKNLLQTTLAPNSTNNDSLIPNNTHSTPHFSYFTPPFVTLPPSLKPNQQEPQSAFWSYHKVLEKKIPPLLMKNTTNVVCNEPDNSLAKTARETTTSQSDPMDTKQPAPIRVAPEANSPPPEPETAPAHPTDATDEKTHSYFNSVLQWLGVFSFVGALAHIRKIIELSDKESSSEGTSSASQEEPKDADYPSAKDKELELKDSQAKISTSTVPTENPENKGNTRSSEEAIAVKPTPETSSSSSESAEAPAARVFAEKLDKKIATDENPLFFNYDPQTSHFSEAKERASFSEVVSDSTIILEEVEDNQTSFLDIPFLEKQESLIAVVDNHLYIFQKPVNDSNQTSQPSTLKWYKLDQFAKESEQPGPSTTEIQNAFAKASLTGDRLILVFNNVKVQEVQSLTPCNSDNTLGTDKESKVSTEPPLPIPRIIIDTSAVGGMQEPQDAQQTPLDYLNPQTPKAQKNQELPLTSEVSPDKASEKVIPRPLSKKSQDRLKEYMPDINFTTIEKLEELVFFPLHYALEKSDTILFNSLLEDGANRLQRDESGKSILMRAAENDQWAICQQLIDKGLSLIEEENGKLPLETFIKNFETKNPDSVISIIEKLDLKGNWPLKALKVSKNPKVFWKLTDKVTEMGPSDDAKQLFQTLLNENLKKYEHDLQSVKELQENGYPLHFAVQNSDVRFLNLLLVNGADPSQLDETGKSILMLAAEKGLFHACKQLIKNGQRLIQEEQNGKFPISAFIESFESKYPQAVIAIIHQLAPTNNWPVAALEVTKNAEIFEVLVDKLLQIKDSTPSKRNSKGKSWLTIAAEKVSWNACVRLIENQYSLIESENGTLPLQAFIEKFERTHEDQIINFIDQLPKDEMWPLTGLKVTKKPKVFCALAAKMTDLNASDDEGKTPFHYAVIGNHKDLIKLFSDPVDLVDINKADNSGRSPLFYALDNVIQARNSCVKSGEKELIKTTEDCLKQLLAAKPDINITDKLGRSPLSYAIISGMDIREFDFLINKNNINTPDKKGFTPLRHAILSGLNHGADNLEQMLDLIEFLLSKGEISIQEHATIDYVNNLLIEFHRRISSYPFECLSEVKSIQNMDKKMIRRTALEINKKVFQFLQSIRMFMRKKGCYNTEELELYNIVKNYEIIGEDKEKFALFLGDDSYKWAVTNNDDNLISLLMKAKIPYLGTDRSVLQAIKKRRWENADFTESEIALLSYFKEKNITEPLHSENLYEIAFANKDDTLIKLLLNAGIVNYSIESDAINFINEVQRAIRWGKSQFTPEEIKVFEHCTNEYTSEAEQESWLAFLENHPLRDSLSKETNESEKKSLEKGLRQQYYARDRGKAYEKLFETDLYDLAVLNKDKELVLLLFQADMLPTADEKAMEKQTPFLFEVATEYKLPLLSPPEQCTYELMKSRDYVKNQEEFLNFLENNPYEFAIKNGDKELVYLLFNIVNPDPKIQDLVRLMYLEVCWRTLDFCQAEEAILEYGQKKGYFANSEEFVKFLSEDPYEFAIREKVDSELVYLLKTAGIPLKNEELSDLKESMYREARWRKNELSPAEMEIFNHIETLAYFDPDPTTTTVIDFFKNDPYGFATKRKDPLLLNLLIKAKIENTNTSSEVIEAINEFKNNNQDHRNSSEGSEYSISEDDTSEDTETLNKNLEALKVLESLNAAAKKSSSSSEGSDSEEDSDESKEESA